MKLLIVGQVAAYNFQGSRSDSSTLHNPAISFWTIQQMAYGLALLLKLHSLPS
jgi:hypothetical protein